jgi:glutathione S-transferase
MFITTQPLGAKTRFAEWIGNLLARAGGATRSALLRRGASEHPSEPFLTDDLAKGSALKLYYRSNSPDSMKVCIALNYKSLPFEKVLVDSADRSELIRISGQSLAPVLWHDGTVVVEAGTILRYLDVNFRDTPPLYSSDRATMNEIERWEKLGRVDLKRCVRILLGNFLSASPDMEEMEAASKQFHEITGAFEKRLGRSPWLVENRFTAADAITGPAVCYGMLLPSFSTLRSLEESIAERFKLGIERARTEEWMMRVMAYDR